jgi:hypothetical protein
VRSSAAMLSATKHEYEIHLSAGPCAKYRVTVYFNSKMGNVLTSCFAKSSAAAVETSSAAAGSKLPGNFFLQHCDAINCVTAAGRESFLSCSDDKSVSLINALNGSVAKRWDIGFAVQRCWWGDEQLCLAADRGGRVTWLVNHDGSCKIGGTCSHKLTVNALAADMQQVMN